jgi:hypothetical protein
MRTAALALVLAVVAGGCGKSNSNPGGGGGGGTGGGGSAGSGGGGGGDLPDAFVPTDGGGVVMNGDAAVLTMTPFPVAAGGEVFMCQTFANPWGVDVDVSKFESHMTTGSHHMLLLFEDNATDGALHSCSGLTFGPMPYGAQQPDNAVTYPAGIGAAIKATQGFNLVVHYLNASPNAIMANVQVQLHRAPAGSVTERAGVFFLNNVSGLYPGIPPGATQTISAQYTTTIPMNILYAVAHMHSRSTNLTATYGNQMLYSTNSWDNAPNQLYQPAVMLPAGTVIQWSCTINNTTPNTLTFGESAATNEMCIFDGQYYPVPAGANPSIDVMK